MTYSFYAGYIDYDKAIYAALSEYTYRGIVINAAVEEFAVLWALSVKPRNSCRSHKVIDKLALRHFIDKHLDRLQRIKVDSFNSERNV